MGEAQNLNGIYEMKAKLCPLYCWGSCLQLNCLCRLGNQVPQKAGSLEAKKCILNSNDALHKEMRDIPWPHAAPRIRAWVQKMQADYQNIKEDTASKTVSEMHDFTNRLKQLGSAEMHSNICSPIGKLVPSEDFQARLQIERQVHCNKIIYFVLCLCESYPGKILGFWELSPHKSCCPPSAACKNKHKSLYDYYPMPMFTVVKCYFQIIEEGTTEEGCKFVEDLLYQGRITFPTTIRLLCLLSLVNNGIPKKLCEQLRRTLLLVFGYENLTTLNHLERAKLLIPRPDSKNPFTAVRRAFHLVYDVEQVESASTDGLKKGFVGKDIGKWKLSVHGLQLTSDNCVDQD